MTTPMRELMARNAHAKARKDFVRLPPWEQIPPVGREQGMAMADAMLDALQPNLETMDGHIMNTICAAFEWPEGAGSFPGRGGLTEAITRGISAYLTAAREGK